MSAVALVNVFGSHPRDVRAIRQIEKRYSVKRDRPRPLNSNLVLPLRYDCGDKSGRWRGVRE